MGNWETAKKIFESMGEKRDLACCGREELGWIGLAIFGFVIKPYFESDICVGCALIDLFAKGFSDLRLAMKDAIRLFLEMVSEGFVPDRFTFSGVLSACAEPGLSLSSVTAWLGD
ncbi:hypothetical protein HAX54_042498 [Datura stramonium]|uniref:Pentatricopeptide repeat-containing protein n=1 Tax=Datura stramonium TaxID=4076 RepID=A0ABS8W1H0_DATST|nr:hypothetical protein [Datura stramonium]